MHVISFSTLLCITARNCARQRAIITSVKRSLKWYEHNKHMYTYIFKFHLYNNFLAYRINIWIHLHSSRSLQLQHPHWVNYWRHNRSTAVPRQHHSGVTNGFIHTASHKRTHRDVSVGIMWAYVPVGVVVTLVRFPIGNSHTNALFILFVYMLHANQL